MTAKMTPHHRQQTNFDKKIQVSKEKLLMKAIGTLKIHTIYLERKDKGALKVHFYGIKIELVQSWSNSTNSK